jgi:hypothetical protein
MIVHVFSNYRAKKDLLGEILVKAQVITQGQLDQALKVQEETLQYLGEILIDFQWVSRDEVLRVIENQIYEAIYDLFQWGEGNFRFDLRLVEKYRKIPLALSPENALLNVLRMLDEWAGIEKKISSPYMVFEKVPAEEMGERYDIGELGQINGEKLSAEGEVVHSLVDSERTVQEVVDRSLLGKFQVYDSLAKLEEGGLIRSVAIERPSLKDLVSGKTFRNISSVLRLGILFAIPRTYSGDSHKIKILKALEIYLLERGEYPEDLQQLVSSEILADWDLFSEGGQPYRYKVGGDGRILLSP